MAGLKARVRSSRDRNRQGRRPEGRGRREQSMRTLRAWSAQPGVYEGELQEFVAGAGEVQETG
jgi:hypothetical protein